LESAVAIVQQHAHGVAREVSRVCHCQVELTVAVEVPHYYRVGVFADGIVHRRLEGTVAITQHHGQFAARIARQRQMSMPAPLKSPPATEKRTGPAAEFRPGLKGPAPFPRST